jgi:hypothetical protein
MTLTLRDLGRHVRHALGVSAEQGVADELTVLGIVNQAGQWLCSAHQWLWLDVATAALDLTTDKDYVPLPSDFRSINNLVATQGLVNDVVLTSMSTVLNYRTQDISTTTFTTWAALSYRRLTTGIPTPVLEIYPTPTSFKAAAMTLHYTAGWLPVSDDGDYVKVPDWIEPLFIQVVREYALGLEGDGGAGVIPRMEALKASSFWMDACSRDGQVQWDLGQILGGAAESHQTMSQFDYPRRIANP